MYKRQNVDLHLNKGEVLGVVGDNGAGKSTLMKVLSGLYKPSEGSLFFDKEKVTLSMTAWSKIFLDKNDLLPLSGLSNIKSILCNENGYYSSYLSDRYGFNNPDKDSE